MAYEIGVEIMGDYSDEEHPSYFLSLKTDKFYFSIGEPYCYSDKEIDSLLERKKGSGIGGGGNSSWSLCIVDRSFCLEYNISGLGLDSTFCWTVEDDKPILEMLNLIKKINKLHEEKKRYVSSSDHIKVSNY